MKIIFLDIDGVLNSADFFKKKHEETGLTQGGARVESIDPDALRLLERILEETDARIVVSSSWRIGRETVEIKKILRLAGFRHWDKIIDRTPSAGSLSEQRGEEIGMWLDEYNEDVETFIILDDGSDMGALLDHLVKTNWEYGLSEYEVKIAIERLNHTNE